MLPGYIERCVKPLEKPAKKRGDQQGKEKRVRDTPVKIELLNGINKGVDNDVEVRQRSKKSTPCCSPIANFFTKIGLADSSAQRDLSNRIHSVNIYLQRDQNSSNNKIVNPEPDLFRKFDIGLMSFYSRPLLVRKQTRYLTN